VPTPDQSYLARRISDMFAEGSLLPGSTKGSVVETRLVGNEVLVMIRWPRDPRLYAIPVDLAATRRDYYYAIPVDTDEEWLDSVGLGFMVMLDTGFRSRARRRLIDDYIELRPAGGWPSDERFYFQFEKPEGSRVAALADHLRSDGLDPSAASTAASEGRLVEWIVAYENNATGEPWVGQAVIARRNNAEADLSIGTIPGTPDFLRINLAYHGGHAAARHGIARLYCAEAAPIFEIAGFRRGDDGFGLDTSLLDADPDRARQHLATDNSGGQNWGRDRDAAGRYMPRSRAGRLLHALRHGGSGRRLRTWIA